MPAPEPAPGEIEVDEAIRPEVRVYGNADQTALALVAYARTQIEDLERTLGARREKQKPPALGGYQQRVVGRERDGGGRPNAKKALSKEALRQPDGARRTGRVNQAHERNG